MWYNINLNFENKNLSTDLTWNAIDIHESLNLEKKYGGLNKVVSLIDDNVLNRLYSKYGVKNEYTYLDDDINVNGNVQIEDLLYDGSYRNGYVNNYNVNENQIKKILCSSINKKIDKDTKNKIINKEISVKMKQEVPNIVEKEYNQSLLKIQNKDNKIEESIRNNFEKWQIAYNIKDLQEMKKQSKEISSNIKKYIKSDSDIIKKSIAIISKTNYLNKKIKKRGDFEITKEEDELLDKFIDDRLKPQIPSKELNKKINQYIKLSYENNSISEDKLQNLEKNIRNQAHKENYYIGYLFEPDNTELEQILKEMEKW